jgi:glycosyltransferase involved in cell wall biosynthesis
MDQRIQVVHQVNQGVSAARNAGLELATGELITFVDGDDAVLPDMYEFLVGLLQTHQADIAHCGYRRIYADGTFKDVEGTDILLEQNSTEACQCLLEGRHFTGGLWNKLYRRELFGNIRFDPDLKINEDILMNVELFRRTEKTVFQDVPKYCYFQRTQSATHVVLPLKARRDCAKVFMQVMELFQDTPIAPTAARRLVYTQLDLYRACLFGDAKGTRQERKEIHQTIQTYAAAYGVNRGRQMWNYRFMRYLPWLYVPVYRLYDKIRKPNIDL